MIKKESQSNDKIVKIQQKSEKIEIKIGNFKVAEKGTISEESEIKDLKIMVRKLTKEDIQNRNLPASTTGVVITNIENDSPINYLNINDIIVEAQKRKIKTIGDLQNTVKTALRSSDKTILIVIYNNQNQKRYIGVKLQ